MNRFWGLVKESTIVQGLVTLCFAGTTCYLYAVGRPVPESLLNLSGLTLGFFFGAKVQQSIR